MSLSLWTLSFSALLFVTGYNDSNMAGGYTQSPGGFASPALSQGGEKKGVSYRTCHSF